MLDYLDKFLYNYTILTGKSKLNQGGFYYFVKIFAIIAEYNPFHSGHLYHLEETRKSADRIVVVMSGSFTQRGDAAIDNKYRRAANAIYAGADMVIELPTLYAVSPADKFAYGALKTLSTMNIDYLSFGSESGNINSLLKAVDILDNESDELRELIRNAMKKGNPLAKAKADAFSKIDNHIELKPNNILALEYIRAIRKLNRNIIPFTIKRMGSDYNDDYKEGTFLSATALRNAIYNDEYYLIRDYIPYTVRYNINTVSNLQKLILYKLNTMTTDELKKIFDVKEGLQNRIINGLKFSDYEVFMMAVKTKRYTMARLKRIFIAALLNITKEFYKESLDAPPYANVLAIRSDRKDMLSLIRSHNIITKPSDIRNVSEEVRPMIELDEMAHKVLNVINEDNSNLNSMQIIEP